MKELFRRWSGEEGIEIEKLPQAGSYRQYYRIFGHWRQAIGVYSPEKQENAAFLSFTKHFLQKGLPVAEIYAEDASKDIY
ncbi:MAG TPA: phosphotransferase, partial [Bacteroidales bacterium]|nr:phosphotransferase [Bacteroidales bacterium]